MRFLRHNSKTLETKHNRKMNVTHFAPHALGAALLDHSKYGFSNKKVEDYKLPQINDTSDYITFRAGLDRVLRAADLQNFFKNIEEKWDFYEWAVDDPPGAVAKAKAKAKAAAAPAKAAVAPLPIALTAVEVAGQLAPDVRAVIAAEIMEAVIAKTAGVPVKAPPKAGA